MTKPVARARTPRSAAPQPFQPLSVLGLEALAAATLLVEARPAAHQPLTGQDGDREEQHEDRQLGG